jgi:hypothetical protein
MFNQKTWGKTMTATFKLDPDSNSVIWNVSADRQITENQAMIISLTNMAWAMSAIAENLGKLQLPAGAGPMRRS